MTKKGKNIVYNRLIRSYITSATSISLVLVLVASLAVFAAHAGVVARWFKENMSVSVMLKLSASEAEGRAFSEKLAGRPYVKESRFISKEEGAEEMKELLGEDFLSVFESSPIPMSIDLKLEGSMISTDSLDVIKAELLKNPLVEDVSYQESLVEALNANLRTISIAVGIVIVVLLAISFALISNTVRLNIYTRRFTIHTMSLVGARRSFIARPFLQHAVVEGAVSGLVASLLLYALLRYAGNGSALFYSLLDMRLVAAVLGGTVLLGVLICVVSTLMVVNKVAYISKDDLYY